MIVVQRMESQQYDGTNGQALAEWTGNAELVRTEGDGTLTLSITAWGLTYEVRVPPGWWVLRQGGMHHATYSPEDYQRLYYELPGT